MRMNLEKGAHKYGLVKSGRKDKDVVSEMQTKIQVPPHTGQNGHHLKVYQRLNKTVEE